MAQSAYRPIQTTISDFEHYTADAKKAMESVPRGDPLYLVLEGLYRDRKSAEDQVRGALKLIRDAAYQEVEEMLVAFFAAGSTDRKHPDGTPVGQAEWDQALEVLMDLIFRALAKARYEQPAEPKGPPNRGQVEILRDALWLGAPDVLNDVGDRLGSISQSLEAHGFTIVRRRVDPDE